MRFFLTYLFLLTSLHGIGQTLFPKSDGTAAFPNYYLHTPASELTDVGLVIFLHGNGPRQESTPAKGFDRILTEGMPEAIAKKQINNALKDYYVLVPHFYDIADGAEWDPVAVREFLMTMISKFNNDIDDDFPTVDMDKIVLVGFSVGGKGAWDYGVKYGHELAGLMPTWGSILPETADYNWCNLVNVPIWAINSEEDPVFPTDGLSASGRLGINDIETRIFECNPNAPFVKTLLAGRGHHGWDEFFNLSMGYEVYEWILAMEKDKNSYAPILSLGDNITIYDNSEQWLQYVSIIDPLNKPVEVEWSVVQESGTPTNLYVYKDDQYVEIRDMEIGQYRITCTANNGNVTSEDQVILNVIPYTGTPDVTNFRMRIDGLEIPLNNYDIIYLPNYDDYISFNIYADNPNSTYLLSGINETRYYNSSTSHPFNYEQGIFNSSPLIGGVRYDPFKIFESGTRRMTFTISRSNFSDVIQHSYQVSVWFTDDPNVLPITLLSFEGDILDNGVRLNWSTTEEVDNSHFEIFRGRTGSDLEKVGETPKAPPGKLYNYYSFTDYEATEGIYYYQLQSVDLDGKRDLSDIIRVAITPGEELLAYPNPATDGQFLVTYPHSEYQQPILYNSHGQAVDFSISPSPNGPGERQLTIKDPRPGMYVLQMMQQGTPVSLKVIVE